MSMIKSRKQKKKLKLHICYAHAHRRLAYLANDNCLVRHRWIEMRNNPQSKAEVMYGNSWLIFTVTTWVNAVVYFKIPHNCPSRVVWPFNGVFISLQRRIQCARKDLIIALIALIECWMLSMMMRTFSFDILYELVWEPSAEKMHTICCLVNIRALKKKSQIFVWNLRFYLAI